MDIKELVSDDKNANRGTETGKRLVRESIENYGAARSILIDKDNRIIAGNKTKEGALGAGIEDVIVVESDGSKLVAVKRTDLSLDDTEARELAIADNRSSELGLEWDIETLNELSSIGVDLDKFWDEDELEELLDKFEQLDPDDPEKDNKAPPLPEDATAKRGEIWQLGQHRVMCGDSTSITDIDLLFDGAVPDIVFSDPPYGINAVKGSGSFGSTGGGEIVPSKTYSKIEGDETTETAKEFYQACTAFGIKEFILWGGNYYTDFVPPSPCWIVWDKQNGETNFADVELAWTSYDKGAKLYQFTWNGLAREGDRKSELVSRVHPTQKPVGLFEAIFKDFKFDTCFDGFLGSGSTLIACEKAGRTCYGMEISPNYVDVIIKRWEDFTGKEAKKIG